MVLIFKLDDSFRSKKTIIFVISHCWIDLFNIWSLIVLWCFVYINIYVLLMPFQTSSTPTHYGSPTATLTSTHTSTPAGTPAATPTTSTPPTALPPNPAGNESLLRRSGFRVHTSQTDSFVSMSILYNIMYKVFLSCGK